jgi:Xaa-Pro aminopeptidase
VAADSRYYVTAGLEAREIVVRERLHALLVTDLLNIRRLCGFTGSNGLLAFFEEDAVLFTDSRYTLQAQEETTGVRVVTTPDPDLCCAEEVMTRGGGYAGFEAEGVTLSRWRRWTKLYPGVDLVDLGSRVTRLRMVKRPEEIAALRRASELSEEAFRRAARLVRPGEREIDVARAFHIEALRLGAGGLSFDTIVAGGERGALPHAVPSERCFRDGDLVVFDFGVRLDGYVSDQTATLSVGKVDGETAEVYETVCRAQKAALEAVRPGALLKDIDWAAREVIREAGHAEHFGHGTGHGVGLAVHEAPTVSPRSADAAQPGMVFTVEPGIYLPGRFGVRLEDTVVVTAEGCARITGLPKELGAIP